MQQVIKPTYLAFTDGSHRCAENKEKGGWAYSILNMRSHRWTTAHGQVAQPTNIRAEHEAIYQALRCLEKHVSDDKSAVLITDCKLAVQTYTELIRDIWDTKGKIWYRSSANKKKEVKNQDLIKKSWEIIQRHPGKFHFVHMWSHVGNEKRKAELASYLRNNHIILTLEDVQVIIKLNAMVDELAKREAM